MKLQHLLCCGKKHYEGFEEEEVNTGVNETVVTLFHRGEIVTELGLNDPLI
jgi:hypothetical protein